MISFRVNKEKTVNALLYLMREANTRGYSPSQYDLVKSLFLADRAHLNRAGRPVTFDSYVAMNHGPVPSFAYDTLKDSFRWGVAVERQAPWTSIPDGAARRFTATEDPDLRSLSESDQNELRSALSTIMSLSFSQIRRLTHEDAAYVAAWRGEDGRGAFPMNMGLLLDDADEDAIDDIRYLSEMASA